MADDAGGGTVAAGQLRSIVERIERLAEDKAEVLEAIKEVYAEAKGNGFDVKTLRKVVALRRQTSAERDEAAAMLDLYCEALGMGFLPLGEEDVHLTIVPQRAAGGA